nr:signal peptidase I [Enterococcus sp. DIV0212c]
MKSQKKNSTKQKKLARDQRTNTASKKQSTKKRPIKPLKKKSKQPRKKLSQKKRYKNKVKKTVVQLMITIGISIVLFSTITYFTLRIPKMEGYAMTTSLTNNDRVVVTKFGEIKRFKIVYFKNPLTKETSLRRIIGLPGDELFYKNDELYINNKLTPERFIEKAVADARQAGFLLTQDFTLQQQTKVTQVPEGKYFVLGDNRQFSNDSRNYGFIAKKDIIGVVELRFFPLHRAIRL